MGEPARIDVESVENFQDGFDRNFPLNRPLDDVEVFFSFFESIENSVEEKCLVVKLAFEEAKVAAIQFQPKPDAMQMFQPSISQVAAPMNPHPLPNRLVTRIAPAFYTLDPFVLVGFQFPVFVYAVRFDTLGNARVVRLNGGFGGETNTRIRHVEHPWNSSLITYLNPQARLEQDGGSAIRQSSRQICGI